MEFGVLLRDLRRKKGIGIKQLAPELAVSYTYLSKLEHNQVRPSRRLSHVLPIISATIRISYYLQPIRFLPM